jgi:dihydrofolate reductase
MQTSIEGIIEEPERATLFNWDEEVRDYSIANTEHVGHIVLGRKTAHGFIPYWNAVAANRDEADFEFGRIIAQIPKIVFSKSLEKSEWENATMSQREIVEQINQLKKKANKEMLVYGGLVLYRR